MFSYRLEPASSWSDSNGSPDSLFKFYANNVPVCVIRPPDSVSQKIPRLAAGSQILSRETAREPRFAVQKIGWLNGYLESEARKRQQNWPKRPGRSAWWSAKAAGVVAITW